ncbi:MAG: acyl--CoA ligase, partial [Ignavibacterium sp.]|nr:acyl--CoA ligase [Ignavibacterium sp.]
MVKEYPRYVVPSITSIQDMLLRSAKVYGDKLALEDLADNPISRVTYKQLHDYVIRFGKSLFEIGIKERDHIAVISENRIQWSMTYFTSMCFNMIIIPIDKNLNHNEILNIIHESEAKAIVFSDGFEPLMKEKRDSLLNLKYYINMDSKEHKDGILSMTKMIEKQSASIERLPFINPDIMAEIIFTSGSLGRAKGVMLTQKNIASNLMAMTSMIQIIPEDRFLSVLPIHHKYECTCGLLCPLYAGASAHYARSLKTVVDDLQKVKATILLGVPLLYDKMFKKIYKGIQEDKLKSVIVPPLISLTNIFESFG